MCSLLVVAGANLDTMREECAIAFRLERFLNGGTRRSGPAHSQWPHRLAVVLPYLNTDHPLQHELNISTSYNHDTTCCSDRSPHKLEMCEIDFKCERRNRCMQVCSNLCRHECVRCWWLLVQTCIHSRRARWIFVPHPIDALLAKTCSLLAGDISCRGPGSATSCRIPWVSLKCWLKTCFSNSYGTPPSCSSGLDTPALIGHSLSTKPCYLLSW